jgi:DNA repair exonuclease SbcCD ATPase subunit
MTRKEPKFIDDLTRVDSTAGDLDSPNDGAIQQAAVSSEGSMAVKPNSNSNSNSNWLLWLFVTVSLCVSFGMAFFGLEEAGKYQAALEKAEAQAKQLEETLERLNRLQTQGIGELAQSDAQMRKMVSSVENKIVNEVTEQLALTSKRMEALSSDVAKTKLDFSALQTDLQSVIENQDSLKENLSLAQNQIMSERARLDQSNKDVASLYERLGTIDKLTGQLIAQLSEVNARVDLAQSAATKALEDKTAVLATEILSEEVSNNRLKIQDSENRLNRQDQINQLASAEAKKLKDRVIALNEIEPQLDKMTRLVEELDAGRQQLTQRIIDLDSRWNEVSRLQGSVATTQRQIEKLENSLKQNADELNRLGSRLDEELKLGSAQ